MSFLTAALQAYGGYGKGRQQRFSDTLAQRQQTESEEDAKARQAYEQQSLAQAASQSAKSLALQQQELALRTQQYNRGIGKDANGNPLPPPLPVPGADAPIPTGKNGQPADPAVLALAYAQKADALDAAARATSDPALQKLYSEQATSYRLQGQAFSGQLVNAAKVPLLGAQTDLIHWKADQQKNWRGNLQTAFDHKMAELKLQGNIAGANRMQAVYAQASAALQREGISQSGAMARTVYSEDARAAIALTTALNPRSATDPTGALAAAKIAYQGQTNAAEASYKAQLAAGNTQAVYQQPTYQPPANVTVNSPITIYQPDGKGGLKPVVIPNPRSGGGSGAQLKLPPGVTARDVQLWNSRTPQQQEADLATMPPAMKAYFQKSLKPGARSTTKKGQPMYWDGQHWRLGRGPGG